MIEIGSYIERNGVRMKCAGIMFVDGERQYFFTDKTGVVTILPADVVEEVIGER